MPTLGATVSLARGRALFLNQSQRRTNCSFSQTMGERSCKHSAKSASILASTSPETRVSSWARSRRFLLSTLGPSARGEYRGHNTHLFLAEGAAGALVATRRFNLVVSGRQRPRVRPVPWLSPWAVTAQASIAYHVLRTRDVARTYGDSSSRRSLVLTIVTKSFCYKNDLNNARILCCNIPTRMRQYSHSRPPKRVHQAEFSR